MSAVRSRQRGNDLITQADPATALGCFDGSSTPHRYPFPITPKTFGQPIARFGSRVAGHVRYNRVNDATAAELDMSHGNIQNVMGLREWLMLLTLSVLWGGSFFFVGVAVFELPPLTIVTLRVALAAFTLWPIGMFMGLPVPTSVRVWSAFFAMGLLNNVVPFTLIVWGQTQIASGLASILNATTPLFTVLVAGLILSDESMTPTKAAGVLVGFGGAVLMIGPEALWGLGTDILAQIAVLGAALSYAFAGVFGRCFKVMGIHPVITAAGQVTASALVLVPISLVAEKPWTLAMPGITTWLCIFGLAVFSTSLAYIIYFRVLATAGATNLLLATFLVPVSAILLGWMFLGERLELIHFVGMGLIGLGLAAIDGRLWQRVRGNLSPPPPPSLPPHKAAARKNPDVAP